MKPNNQYYVNPRPTREEDRLNPWILRLFLLGLAGMVLLFFAGIALLAGYQFMTQDQIHAGVSPIFGVDVTGMTRQEAQIALSQQFTYEDEATFTFVYNEQEWVYTAGDLGIEFDVEGTVARAYNVGREGAPLANLVDQWQAWQSGHAVRPVIRYNQTIAQTEIASLAEDYINQPMVDATLVLQDGAINSTSSQTGLRVDVLATLALLEQEVLAMNTLSQIELVVEETQPNLLNADTAAAQVSSALDDRGVTFFVPESYGIGAGPWIARPESIENMLRVERVDNEDGTAYYDVFVTLDDARDFLTGLSTELGRSSQNARFVFNDTTRQLEPIEDSINGLELDIEGTLAGFPRAVFSAEDRSVPLVFEETIPVINSNATAEELGITELVVEATTFYFNSTPARRANIQVTAARMHGVVIPPGGDFSFNEWLGDVSVEEGFEEALIIVGNQTITGVGGGVCQVTTTVFQAAFYGGFPILERYPHGYRVGYYEEGEGPGMDATVYSPVVDFRFQNDTPHHLLIETYVRPGSSTITVKFYSTDIGRRVVKDGPIVRNEEPPPPPIYRANPNLSLGEIRQVDYAVAGAEVFVYRTIYQDDEIIVDREEFYSRYIPWPNQYEVAPDDDRINS